MKVIKYHNRFSREVLKYQLLEIVWLAKVLNNLCCILGFDQMISRTVIDSDYSMITLA